MKLLNAEFVLGAKSIEQFPKLNLPEAAFTGRSNVGKSSLLNSILMRKQLAKTSGTPGKTKEINFFAVQNQHGKAIWTLADLPGFGYATVSKEERLRFSELNIAYLSKRSVLKLVCVLIDSRHDPMESDLSLIEWLENNDKTFVIVLTKSDKISAKQILLRKEQIDGLVANCKNCIDVLPYSIVSGTGRVELTAIIKRICI